MFNRCRVPCVDRSVTRDPPSTRIVPIRATSTKACPDAGTSSVPPTASCDDADDDGPETLHGRPEGHVNLHCENPMPVAMTIAAAAANFQAMPITGRRGLR